MRRKVYAKKAQKRSRSPKRVYLDHAATTPVSLSVQKAMAPFWATQFGNPSSISQEGVQADRAVGGARKDIADILRVLPSEIVFTSSGTEANSLAINGILENAPKGHVIASVIEHPSVLEPIKAWEKKGGTVSWVPVSSSGVVEVGVIKKLVRPETILISVQYANNEIGTVQPIAEIAKLVRYVRKQGQTIYFHTDACQAPGLLPLGMPQLGVDLASFSAQKYYGPKGIGFLFVRRGTELVPQLRGGGHEQGLRAGTENVPAVVGMARALRDAEKSREKTVTTLSALRDWFIAKVATEIPGTVLNGDAELRLASNINISVPGVEGELMTLSLDAAGFAVSPGSACGTKDNQSSYVVTALGGVADRVTNAMRITLGVSSTKKDLARLVVEIKKVLERQTKSVIL